MSRPQSEALAGEVAAAARAALEGLETRRLFALPVADAGGPYAVLEGGSVLVSGLGSTDDGQIVTYQWDTNYDVNRGFRPRFTGARFNFVAGDSGTRTIALRVTDDQNDQNLATATINISDVAPTLTLNAPNNAAEGQAVNVSWGYTDPGQSDAVNSWTLDWGDGLISTYTGDITSASHAYAEDGVYSIELTATQTDATTTITHAITIDHSSPQVNATTPDATLDEGGTATLNFSSPNRQSTIEGWVIDWGDGSIDVLPQQASSATHAYVDSGTFVATITALEPDGGVGSSNVTFSVANVAPQVTITGVPATGVEGSSIAVGSIVTDAGVNDTHIYGWTVYRDGSHFALPGGTVLDDPAFTFTPTDNGNFVIRLTVIDSDGASTTINSAPIAVSNVAPAASISGEPGGSIDEGSAVNLTSGVTDAGALDTFGYVWTISKDGFAYMPGVTVTNSTLSFSPRDNGTYVATLTVTDDDGGSDVVQSASIVVDNVAPVASIAGMPAGNVNEGNIVNLSATITDAGADDSHTYIWTVEKDGNPFDLTGVTTTAANFGFVPTDDGSYVVTLQATDDDGASDTFVSAAIIAQNVAPAPTISGPIASDEGVTVTFVANPNDVGAEDTHSYLWSVTKNGVAFDLTGVTVDEASFTFTPPVRGEYLVRVEVTDDDAGQGVATHNVSVANLAPVVSISGVPVGSVFEGDTINLAASATDPGGDTNLTYAWTITRNGVAFAPSGLVVNTPNLSFVATDNGNYRATVSVTDTGGAVASSSTSGIAVLNVAPTGIITNVPLTSVNEGTPITLGVSVADVGAEDTHTLAWSVAKDGQPFALPGNVIVNASSFTFVPTDNGTYVASVTITDDDTGATTVTSAAISVANVAPVADITGEPAQAELEGILLALASDVADAGSLDTFTYAWSVSKDGQPFALAGGTVTDAATFSFVATDNGAYVVSLTVTDDDAAATTVTSDPIVIDNAAPAGTISGPAIADEGSTVTLTTSISDPGSLDNHTYAWTVTKDGVAYDLTGIATDQPNLTFTPDDNAAYVASVTVTDSDGASVTLTHDLAVSNLAPSASLVSVPSTTSEGTLSTVASLITDSGSDTFTYGWTIRKDGTPIYPAGVVMDQPTLAFVPPDNGIYTLRLTVVDDDGASTTINSGAITVTNVAPSVAIDAVQPTMDEATTQTLTGTVSDAGADDVTAGFSYLWTAQRGGQTVQTGTDASFNFTPAVHGVYTITLRATDKDAASTTTTATTITVGNVAPGSVQIEGIPSSMNEGEDVRFTATATDAPGDTHTYAWTILRNGQAFASGQGQEFVFDPNARGNYQIEVVATDSAGATATATQSLVVENLAPVVNLSPPDSPILIGETATMLLNVSDIPQNQSFVATWDFGDGSAPLVQNLTGDQVNRPQTYTYATSGVFTVTVSISDGVDTTTATATVNVTRAAVRTSPFDLTQTALMVVGTSGNDTITVEPAATAGLWKVTMNGVVLGESFNPTGRVVISGGSGGADGIVVTGNINAVVKDLGGPSYVQTDSGNDVVIGSSANDYITTGGGRDIIAGNAGADTIRGGAGEDAIVADTINWGSNNTSIRAALETWNGADAFAARVTAMKNTPLFGSSAITNDGVQDHLFGETQADWFVLNSAVDRLRDFQAGVDISN